MEPDDFELAKIAGRELALKLIGPFFDAVHAVVAEERRKGRPESEIQAKVEQLCAIVENEHRGKVEDFVIEDMLTLLREAAMRTHEAPKVRQ